MASEELRLVADSHDLSPSQQIARRVRGLLGENQISGRRMAKAMGMNTSSFSRRYNGELAWTTDELGTLSSMLKVPFSELCAIRDSNPEPADSEPRGLTLVGPAGRRVSNVTPLVAGHKPGLAVVHGGAA